MLDSSHFLLLIPSASCYSVPQCQYCIALAPRVLIMGRGSHSNPYSSASAMVKSLETLASNTRRRSIRSGHRPSSLGWYRLWTDASPTHHLCPPVVKSGSTCLFSNSPRPSSPSDCSPSSCWAGTAGKSFPVALGSLPCVPTIFHRPTSIADGAG